MSMSGPSEPDTSSPLLLDRFMPAYDLTVVHCRVFRVPGQECLDAVLAMDAFDSRLIRVLITARGLPGRLRGRRPTLQDATFRIRDMTHKGWLLLGETPGVEVVLGSIAQPWKPGGMSPGRTVTPEDFAGFDDSGFGKIAIGFRVVPYGAGASILTVETRILLTDPDSRGRFLRYWRFVGPFSHVIRWRAMRMLDRRLKTQQKT